MEMEAKKKMLQKLKGDMREKMHKSLPEAFKGKKVIIEADSEEGLEKGLSMAQKIMKGKLGEMMEHSEESSESEEESCGECGDEDCYSCGGKEKYRDGGVEASPGDHMDVKYPEEKPKEEEKEQSFREKYFKGFQGTKPFVKK
jgi:hypothetical protein